MYKHMKKDFKGKRDKTCETNKLKKKKKKNKKSGLGFLSKHLHTQPEAYIRRI